MSTLDPERYTKSFVKRFKELLKEYNGTHEQLAKELGLKSKSNITKYANGSITINITMLTKIADFFEVSPIWLLGDTDDRHYNYKKNK